MEKEHRKEDKATERYSHLARWGLRHACSQALLELRQKQCATGFESVAKLYKVVSLDLEEYEGKMMDSLLGVDTLDRRHFRHWSGI